MNWNNDTNTSIKQTLVLAGIALAFLAVLAGGILIVDTAKKTDGNVQSGSNSGDDMASMHAPPPPADNSKFQSLLGKNAPDFKLTSYDGREVNLSDFKGKNVVLFFSEGAMCYPSCWDQINAFTNDSGFSKENTIILTIVVDPKTDWEGVVRQDSKIANATVLLDTDKKVSTDYGVLTVDSSMHRGQFPGHTYIILDKEGIVRYLLDDADMQIRNKELLKELEKVS